MACSTKLSLLIALWAACCLMVSGTSLFERFADLGVRSTSCSEGEFDCGNGRCISDSKRCDGKGFDCKLNADEKECDSCKNPNSFYCASDKRCLSAKTRCNVRSECGDWSDEQNCDSCQGPNAFHCPSERRCTRIDNRCDGYPECAGGEDELNCDTCRRDAFLCPTSRKCIPSHLQCNYVEECPSGEDEDNCGCDNGFRCEAGVKPGVYNSTNPRFCLHSRYACDKTSQCVDGQDEADCSVKFRLVGGSSANEGRLEVSWKGVWGTVCDDNFDTNGARVACRQLGFPGQSASLYDPIDGIGNIWLDDVMCTGDEESLFDCPHRSIGEHNCGHSEDVGLRCGDQLELFETLACS